MSFLMIIGIIGFCLLIIGLVIYDSCSFSLHEHLIRDQKIAFWKESLPILLMGMGLFMIVIPIVLYITLHILM